jgi:hypothetical protein
MKLVKTTIRWHKRTIKEYPITVPEGMSYRKLAKLTGINFTYFSKIFTGKRVVLEKLAARIIEAVKNEAHISLPAGDSVSHGATSKPLALRRRGLRRKRYASRDGRMSN